MQKRTKTCNIYSPFSPTIKSGRNYESVEQTAHPFMHYIIIANSTDWSKALHHLLRHKTSMDKMLKERDVALCYYNNMGNMTKFLKKGSKLMQQNQRHHLLIFNTFFFLVKTWCSHNPQRNTKADRSGVLC